MAQWHYDPRVDHRYMAQPAPQSPLHSTHPPQHPGAQPVSGVINFIGAVMSVALLAGVGVWSYRLMVRDVSGVPVVRALDGPMRISPSDPGGRQAQFQGLAVNSVAAMGGAQSAPVVPDAVVLAPAAVELLPDDHGARMVSVQPAIAAPPIAAPSASQAAPSPVDLALAAPEAIAPAPGGATALASSPRPRPRPASLRASAPALASAPVTDSAIESILLDVATRLSAPRVTEVDPASLTPGTRLVQLGAYETEDEARVAWDAMAQRFGAHMEGHGRVIEPATSGGRVFYRLRAHGFGDEPEARRFCSVLLAEGADCIPVLIR